MTDKVAFMKPEIEVGIAAGETLEEHFKHRMMETNQPADAERYHIARRMNDVMRSTKSWMDRETDDRVEVRHL